MTTQSCGARRNSHAALFVVAVCVTTWVLRHQFGHTSIRSLRAALAAQTGAHLLAALTLTALSFASLALYDLFGVAAVARRRVPARFTLLAGATANAIGNTLGFHVVTGSAVRARIYLRHGLTRTEVVRVVSLSWLALGLGFLTMLAGAELVRSFAAWPRASTSLCIGLGIGAGIFAFVVWLARGPRRLRLFGFSQPLPSARAALLQLGIGAIESAAAIGALYVLLPADLAVPFSVFAVACIAAVALGVVAHVPGGIGIFEASITAILSGTGRADLLAALLVYRAVYNLLPFLLSVAALLLLGYGRKRQPQLEGG